MYSAGGAYIKAPFGRKHFIKPLDKHTFGAYNRPLAVNAPLEASFNKLLEFVCFKIKILDLDLSCKS